MKLDELLESLPIIPHGERQLAPLEPAKSQDELIQSVETLLYQESMEVVRDANRFREIDAIPVDDMKIPVEWVQEVGLEKARQRYRTALAGAMNAKEAPFALKMAATTAAGMARARAVSQSGPRSMNATFIQINADSRVDPTAPKFVYERKEVDE